ncbi:MAG TPA: phosphotransferase [Streptosporangiaceae bacterium]|nr:phosphotransferase [Streptosporangiaceae bacterium]
MPDAPEDAAGYPAADYTGVFTHFGAEQVPDRSVYLWSPVFPCLVGGHRAVIKRTRRTPEGAAAVAAVTRDWLARGIPVVTALELSVDNPVRFEEKHWVAYPFIEGERYAARFDEIEAAGTLLGRIHALGEGPARLPVLNWPDDEQALDETDAELLREVVTAQVPEPVLDRLVVVMSSFVTEVLPVLRASKLPLKNVCMDYKATNLIYTEAGPVLVDPDNGDFAPRILDLAQAALLFHTDHEDVPARPFSKGEWAAFIGAYLREVELTDDERLLWPTALHYMLAMEGHWAFTGSPEEWEDPRQRSFLLALANTRTDDFPLPVG